MSARKKVLTALLVFSVLVWPVVSHSQSSLGNTGTVKKFTRGMIIKKDRARFQGRSLVFDAQSLRFQDVRTQQSVTLPLSEVDYVRAKTGTHTGEGALFGGGLFLLAGLSAWQEAESDPTTEVTNAGKAIAITTAIGVVGGFIIGTFFPKEKMVYQKNKFSTMMPPLPGSRRSDDKVAMIISLKIPF